MAASNGVPDMTVGTGFAEVFDTVTSALTTAWTARGARIDAPNATSDTPKIASPNLLSHFFICVLLPSKNSFIAAPGFLR
ncbi:MAG: hypothetical protein WBP79_14655 [Candidatus Acidiferrales bacterium]